MPLENDSEPSVFTFSLCPRATRWVRMVGKEAMLGWMDAEDMEEENPQMRRMIAGLRVVEFLIDSGWTPPADAGEMRFFRSEREHAHRLRRLTQWRKALPVVIPPPK